MALTNEDLRRIYALFAPFENRLEKIEKRVDEGFDIMAKNFDALFKRDELRQQEYSVLAKQFFHLEKRASTLEQKCG